MRNSPSSAAISKLLSGITFPKNKKDLLRFVQKNNKSKLKNENTELLKILDNLPEKTYQKITEIQVEVGKLR